MATFIVSQSYQDLNLTLAPGIYLYALNILQKCIGLLDLLKTEISKIFNHVLQRCRFQTQKMTDLEKVQQLWLITNMSYSATSPERPSTEQQTVLSNIIIWFQK